MTEKTSLGKIVAAAGGIVLIISLFLKWYGVDISGAAQDAINQAQQLGGVAGQAAANAAKQAQDDSSGNAFGLLGFTPFLYLVIGVLAILPAAFDVFDMEIELPFDVKLVSLVGGVLAVGGILVVIDLPGGSKFGVWLALLGSLAVAIGGAIQGDEAKLEAAGAPAPPQPAAQTFAPPPAAPQAPTSPPAEPPQPPSF